MDIDLDSLVSYCATIDLETALYECLLELGTDFRCIITEDTGSMTLMNMFENEQMSEVEVVNILSMIVLSIYILNVH